MLYEVKLYIFLISISSLLLILREQVKPSILVTYVIASIFGIKTISCLILGKCYYEVYYFLIGYAIINILCVFYFPELNKWFPRLWKDISKKRTKRIKGGTFKYLEKDLQNNITKI